MPNKMTAYQRLVIIAYSFILIANAVTWLAILIWLDHSQAVTILHYNIYFGPDVFGNWSELLFLPAIALVVSIIDFVLTTLLWRRDRFLAYASTAGAIGTQVVIMVAVALMIQVNRS